MNMHCIKKCKLACNMFYVQFADFSNWIEDVLALLHVSWAGLKQDALFTMLSSNGYSGDKNVSVFAWTVFLSAAGAAILKQSSGLFISSGQHRSKIFCGQDY